MGTGRRRGWALKPGWAYESGIINPSFEAAIDAGGNTAGWNYFFTGSVSGSIEQDGTDKTHGSYSVMFSVKNGTGHLGYRQYISAVPWRGQTIQIKVDCKSTYITNTGLFIISDGTSPDQDQASPSVQSVWETLVTEINVGGDAEQIRIDVYQYRPGIGTRVGHFDNTLLLVKH